MTRFFLNYWSVCLIFVSIFMYQRTGFSDETSSLTLEQLVDLALVNNLSLRIAERELAQANRAIKIARIPSLSNPELSGGTGIRIASQERNIEAEVELSQTFQLGKSRHHRVARASAEAEAAEKKLEGLRLFVAAQTRLAAIEYISQKEHIELSRKVENLSRELFHIAEERLRADTGTVLEVNLAALELARAKRNMISYIKARNSAALELHRILANPIQYERRLSVKLSAISPISEDKDTLVQFALKKRPEISMLTSLLASARNEYSLARSEALPELSIGATYSFEEGDHITGIGLGIPLPLIHRNQKDISEARLQMELMELELESGRRAIENEVRLAFQNYLTSLDVLELLKSDVSTYSKDNLILLKSAFEEGKVGIMDVVLMHREFVTVQHDMIEALSELHKARIEVELSVGGEVR